jgi:hypothetical protein
MYKKEAYDSFITGEMKYILQLCFVFARRYCKAHNIPS